MIKKLIVLGMDGLDYDVVMKYSADLPNLYGLMAARGFPRLRSMFPADTTPAWASIFTGLDPSRHGIINFVNVGDEKNACKSFVFDDSALRGKTFWDRLGNEGCTCAVLLPMDIKLGWKINGLMITRPYEGKIRVYPPEEYDKYKPDAGILGTEGKFTSEKRLGRLYKEFTDKASEEFRLCKTAAEGDYDLLFSYFSTPDGVQHDFWRHCDENHPEYPGANPYSDAVRGIYRLMDGYVGQLRAMCPDTPLLIISDHGHGARPVRTVKINEMLREGGWFTPTRGEKPVKSGLKKSAVKFVKRFGLPKAAVKAVKRFPVWKRLFASGDDIDREKTVAYLSDLSAVKNYSYGGIRVRAEEKAKDGLCDEIIQRLSQYEIDGKPAFLWLRRTDTLYHGEYLCRYPEIIFQLDERFGAVWETGGEIFGKSGYMHSLSPGAHRYETAVIAASGIELDKAQYELTDIYGIITDTVRRGT